MSGLNWAQPVFGSDVKTSQAYLERLQAFLEMQQPGGSSSSSKGQKGAGVSGGGGEDTPKTKRKAPMSSSSSSAHADGDSAQSALKDRKHGQASSPSQAQHSHNNEDREDSVSDSPPGKAPGGGRSSKGSTSEKRKEQNRNAQRAFRERKEKVLRDLEDKISDLNKIVDERQNENQNLKELVMRLQEENARLQSGSSSSSVGAGPALPQSEFTFSVPGTSTQHQPSASDAPASYSDADIMAFLNSAPPQQLDDGSAEAPTNPFTMIEPTAFPNLGDGWSWNQSSFGTEIPTAAPPSVTNLLEMYPDFASSNFGDANSNTSVRNNSMSVGPSPSSSSASPSNQMPSTSPQLAFASGSNASQMSSTSSYSDANQVFNSLFGGGFSSGFTTGFSPSTSAGSPSTSIGLSPPVSVGNNGSGSTSSAVGANTFSTGQAGTVTSAGPLKQTAATRMASKAGSLTHNADSPDTTCSSNGSDPSEHQPATPGNAPYYFGGINIAANGNNAPAWLNTAGNEKSKNASSALGPQSSTGNGPSPLAVTTPSGIFDMMDYRDPVLNGLQGSNDFDSFSTMLKPDQHQLHLNSDLLDFNDFLVQSPPSSAGTALSPAGPSTGAQSQQHQQNSGSNGKRAESSSGSSIPTLSSSQSNSPSAGSSAAHSPASIFNNIGGTINPESLTLDSVTYGHPMIQHAMADMFAGKSWAPDIVQSAISQQQTGPTAQGNHRASTNAVSPLTENDLDTLCKDMKLKATCKEVARERIAKSVQSDETMLKLYNEYLQNGGQ